MKTMLNPFHLILLFIFLCNTIKAQAPDTLWTKTYGGTREDRGKAAKRTADGGFILLGDKGKPDEDLWLVKVDSAGDKEWDTQVGENGRDRGNGVIETSDGDFVMIGSFENIVDSSQALYVVKANASGAVQWEQKIFSGIQTQGFDIIEVSGGAS